MKAVLTFIRQWLPSVAIIVYGGWTLFKMLFAEHLRSKKDMPSIDGQLSAETIPLCDGCVLVTLSAIWNNHSPLPVHLDTKTTIVSVYRIPGDIREGPLSLQADLHNPVHTTRPYKELEKFLLEPNTSSLLQTHFVLPIGSVYGFLWKLNRHPKHGTLPGWTKELILDVRKGSAEQPPARGCSRAADGLTATCEE
jgi:hypothetical protein